jgi:hypothetical protein
MSRFSPLLKRLHQLELDPEYIEPWPPDEEGSLSKVLYDQLKAEGFELPAKRPEPTTLMYLLKKGAERCWEEEADGEAGFSAA